MKKKTGIIIFILSGLSILGVIVTQLFWLENTYKLKNQQFDDKIMLGLTVVANKWHSEEVTQIDSLSLDSANHNLDSSQFVALDSLLIREFENFRIDSNYVYAIYLHQDDNKTIVSGGGTPWDYEIISSTYRVSLACLSNQSKPYYLAIYFSDRNHIICHQLFWVFIISGLFVLIIGFSFFYVIYFVFRYKQTSVVKNDFINNMTHEFKTPISTVSISAEMLLRDGMFEQTEKARRYAKIIYHENQRLKHLVEQVLQMAVMDKGELKIRRKDIDAHKIINDVISKSEVLLASKGGLIKTYLAANNSKIWADRMHLTNIISNLLENANKYSSETPIVVVRTRNIHKGLIISVEDNGIGVKSENQKEIFRQFYRVPTGNLHDVKGFGLGLYYVKLMTEAHGGSIKIISDWGKGSTFELFFPFKNELK